ncbi:GP179 protein, partial [Formicarius rufipectus]|nr:GP179 protein [Formicarius rufipectus]
KPREKGSKEPSGKSQSTESLKAEICPWEVQELESSERDEICPWEGAEPPSHQSKAKQVPGRGSKAGNKRITRQAALASPERSPGKKEQEVGWPWDSLGTWDPSGTAPAGSPGLPKAPPGKSQSTESLKAEICPWEVQELESSERDDICPWEGAQLQLERGKAPGKDKHPQKGTAASKSWEKG